MKKTLIFTLILCLALLSACGSPAEGPSGVGASTPDGGASKAPIAMPESFTDPSTIAVDGSLLARADGRILGWDAAPVMPDDPTIAGAPASAFDASGWPDNEYTNGLPLPLMGKVSMSGNDEESPGAFIIVFEGMPYDSFLEYLELLKEAGYTKNAQTEDFSAYGMGDGIMYTATGSDGRTIEAMSAMGTTMLSIKE